MIFTQNVDAIVGLQYGDEGKGKITAGLINSNQHDICIRYNGGPNAGHTIVRDDGKVFKLHQLPSSLVYNKPAHIGSGCVINAQKLFEEIQIVKSIDPNINVTKNLSISSNVCLIQNEDIEKDSSYHHSKQGSTNQGIAPAYANFYNRTAKLIKDSNLINVFNIVDNIKANNTLLEGAQGFYLDPFNGRYPYTTSSHCLPAAAAGTLGFDPRKFRNIIGVAKCYETRSGEDPNFYTDVNSYSLVKYQSVLNRLVSLGKEFGVTTGRQRKVRFLNLDELIHSTHASGCNIVVINKWDIFEQVNQFSMVFNNELTTFKNLNAMQNAIVEAFNHSFESTRYLRSSPKIIFSASPKNDIDWNVLND
jgi:adenylosuccinate synthase